MSASDDDRVGSKPPRQTVADELPPPETRPCRLRIVSRGVRKFDLTATNYAIGSGPDCGIRITDDLKVSSVHARVFFKDGRWCLRDAGSVNSVKELTPGGHETGRLLPEIIGWQVGQGVKLGQTSIWLELVPTKADALRGFHGIIGRSAAMRVLYAQLSAVGPTLATVLLTGQTGTGKGLAAKVLHQLSGRKGELVTVNCGTLTTNELSQSALFGHTKGAFTGAHQDRTGAFRKAEGGTLFLDEFGDLHEEGQISLLRALEERWVKPLGSDSEVPVDVRVIVGTHKDPRLLIAKGKLREDLFHRVNVFPVHMPSLARRWDDFPDLVDSFSAEAGHPGVEWPAEVIRYLRGLPLPGNVRELRNLVERALINSGGRGPIAEEHFKDPTEVNREEKSPEAKGTKPIMVDIANKSAEQLIDEAFLIQLELHKGNAAAAGRVLGFGEAKARKLRDRLVKDVDEDL